MNIEGVALWFCLGGYLLTAIAFFIKLGQYKGKMDGVIRDYDHVHVKTEEHQEKIAVLDSEVKSVNLGVLRIETSIEKMRTENMEILLDLQKQIGGK